MKLADDLVVVFGLYRVVVDGDFVAVRLHVGDTQSGGLRFDGGHFGGLDGIVFFRRVDVGEGAEVPIILRHDGRKNGAAGNDKAKTDNKNYDKSFFHIYLRL